MTLAKDDRLKNHVAALSLMIEVLGDRAIDTSLFDPTQPPFAEQVLRTTWEELARQDLVDCVTPLQYRLTARGWLVGLEVTDISKSTAYQERLGRVLAAMKRHVEGRKDSAIVPLAQLATESGEPEGWIFNVVDSRSSSTGNKRTGASWYEGVRGRLVEVPVDFNLEPVDIVSALTVGHLEKIEALEARLEEAEEDRARFHCPYCDAPLTGVCDEDVPDYHCSVTHESFACGYATADGFEEVPCPYGPDWPNLDEFEFITEQEGNLYVCYVKPKTARARRVDICEVGRTKEEAEERARKAAAPKREEASPRS
jgi:hypothetical protein